MIMNSSLYLPCVYNMMVNIFPVFPVCRVEYSTFDILEDEEVKEAVSVYDISKNHVGET